MYDPRPYLPTAIFQAIAAAAVIVSAVRDDEPAPTYIEQYPYDGFLVVDKPRVIDGDTIHADAVRLPWGLSLRPRAIRLMGIDTPELSIPEQRDRAIAASKALEKLIADSRRIYVRAPRVGLDHDLDGRRILDDRDSLGRILGHLWVTQINEPDEEREQAKSDVLIDVAAWLIDHGHAKQPGDKGYHEQTSGSR